MFGLSSSKQSSQSSSLDFGVTGSFAESGSQGFSQATSGGRSTQNIAFADVFSRLFGGAEGAAAAASGMVPTFQGEAAQLFSGGINFLSQLQGGGPEADYLAERVSGPDTAAQAQIDALGGELGDFFNEQLLPGITGGGVATGTLGGSRQGVNTALAAKQVANQFVRGSASILGASQAQRDAIATTMAGNRTASAGAGLAALPGLLGLSSAGANASLSPYLALAQILGGPTVLTASQQFGQSTSADVARSLSESFGFNYGTSQSSSKGRSFGLSVGPFGAASG
jgi:hypothetical protein